MIETPYVNELAAQLVRRALTNLQAALLVAFERAERVEKEGRTVFKLPKAYGTLCPTCGKPTVVGIYPERATEALRFISDERFECATCRQDRLEAERAAIAAPFMVEAVAA